MPGIGFVQRILIGVGRGGGGGPGPPNNLRGGPTYPLAPPPPLIHSHFPSIII